MSAQTHLVTTRSNPDQLHQHQSSSTLESGGSCDDVAEPREFQVECAVSLEEHHRVGDPLVSQSVVALCDRANCFGVGQSSHPQTENGTGVFSGTRTLDCFSFPDSRS